MNGVHTVPSFIFPRSPRVVQPQHRTASQRGHIAFYHALGERADSWHQPSAVCALSPSMCSHSTIHTYLTPRPLHFSLLWASPS